MSAASDEPLAATMSLPPDTITHVTTLNGQPLSQQTREALVTLLEVAYAAAQRGILPDESHCPPCKSKHKMNARIKKKLAAARARRALCSLLNQHNPADVAHTLEQMGSWGGVNIQKAPTADEIRADRFWGSYANGGSGRFNGRFAR